MSKKVARSQSDEGYDHGAMIKDPARWPCWPYLPVKRGDHSLDRKNLGVVLADEGLVCNGNPTVYYVYLFDLPKSPEEWKAAERTEYATITDMLQDGWVVD